MKLATANGSEKVFLFNFDHIGTKLADVNAISYSTYRSAGSAQQVAALNVVIDFNGPAVDGGFSTLVFEPVYNSGQGAVVSGEWQDWTATGSGIWWSTRAINGQCAGATSTCDKTWTEIVANNPDATILGGVGINQGSGNPGLTTNVDAFTFDDTTYDFELTLPDTDGDGVPDRTDNCDTAENPDQLDTDGDELGDACDPDIDGDGVPNEPDNCDTVPNADQNNNDGDAQGDLCDPDDDNDTIIDGRDNCQFDPNTNQADGDGDAIGNVCDDDAVPPTTAEQCKKGGWANFYIPRRFKNQGDCIQYVNTRK